jgi:hypothetical protein
METFASRFLEKCDYLLNDNQEWNWEPNMIILWHSVTSSTTNCGGTQQYNGNTDVGADDTHPD